MIKYRDKETGEELYWYEMWEIRFNQAHVKFLFPALNQLRIGKYPPRPEGYGCQEVMTRTAGNAAFTKPVELAGELDFRIKQCGFDGFLTLGYYVYEIPIIEMMTQCDQSEGEIWNRIGRCIRFCAGWKRKKVSYREFVNHRFASQPRREEDKTGD